MQASILRDVFEANKSIVPYLRRTPLQHSPGLSMRLDAHDHFCRRSRHQGRLQYPQVETAATVDDIVLVSDYEIRCALGVLIEEAHTLAGAMKRQ